MSINRGSPNFWIVFFIFGLTQKSFAYSSDPKQFISEIVEEAKTILVATNTKEIKTKLGQANTVLIALIDRIRMLDNDIIRLKAKVKTAIELKENLEKKKNKD